MPDVKLVQMRRLAVFEVPADRTALTLVTSGFAGGTVPTVIGGGAVDSVNGQTGVVVLTAAHVDADPEGTAAGLVAALSTVYQPLDADLTAIAALSTTSFGRAFLTLANAAAGRTALGLGTAALSASGDFQPVDSDLTAIAALTTTSYGRGLLALADAAAARSALGLGTAATQATTAFDAAGAAAAAQAASQPLDSDLTAIAALSTTSYGRALLALADAAAGRTALGLGTAATQNTGAFDAAGAAAAAQAASQPLDADLTAIAALSTTSFGRAFLGLANLAALQAVLGTGTPSSSTYLRGDGTWATPAGGGGGDLLAANNLSDLANAGTARTNLGLGTAATQASTAFDAAGSAAAAEAAAIAASQPLDSDLTAIAALSTTSYGRALLALADAAAARTALGLGTAATQASTAFDAAGSAAAAQAASQPLDSDLTAIAALTTTSFGRGLLALADAAALRTAAGLTAAAVPLVDTAGHWAADDLEELADEIGDRVEALEADAGTAAWNGDPNDLDAGGFWNRKELPGPGSDNVGVCTVGVADYVGSYGMVPHADLFPTGPNDFDPTVIHEQLEKLAALPNFKGAWLRPQYGTWAAQWLKDIDDITVHSSDQLGTPSPNVGSESTCPVWWNDYVGAGDPLDSFLDAYEHCTRVLWDYFKDDPRVLGLTAAVGCIKYDEPFQRNFDASTLTNMLSAGYTAAKNRAAIFKGWEIHADLGIPTDCAFNPYVDWNGSTWDFIDTSGTNTGTMIDTFIATLGHNARPSQHSLRTDTGGPVNTGVTTGSKVAGDTSLSMTGETFSADQYNNTATSFDVAKECFIVIETTPRQVNYITDTGSDEHVDLLLPLPFDVPAGTAWSIYVSPNEWSGRRYREIYNRLRASGVPFVVQTASQDGIGEELVVCLYIALAGYLWCELNSNAFSDPYDEEPLAIAAALLEVNAQVRPQGAITERVVRRGTATSTGSNTLTDSTFAGVGADDDFVGMFVRIVGGSGDGASNMLESSTASSGQIQGVSNWSTNGTGIGTGCEYEIVDLAWAACVTTAVPARVLAGYGSPEGVIPARPGMVYTDGQGGTWTKATGNGRDGWALVGGALPNVGPGAGEYGSGSLVPVLTLDAQGRVTDVDESTVVAATPPIAKILARKFLR